MVFRASWGRRDTYARIPENRHSYAEVLYCREGEGVFFAENTEFPVHAGDVIYIPPGTLHSDSAEHVIRWNGHLNFDPVPNLPDHIVFFHDMEMQMFHLIDMVARAQLTSDPRDEAFALALRDAIMVLLQNWSVDEVRNVNQSVESINQLIMNQFSDVDFDLAGEIAKTGYSSGYFRQLFRSAVGRPPQSQLTHVRIEYAKQQMHIQHSGVSIKTISTNAGFRDPYYFSRLFKQYEGISPKQYFRLVRDQ